MRALFGTLVVVALVGCFDTDGADVAAAQEQARENVCSCFMLATDECNTVPFDDVANTVDCFSCLAQAGCAQLQTDSACGSVCNEVSTPIYSNAARHACDCAHLDLDDPECSDLARAIADASDECRDCVELASCDKLRANIACNSECGI